jgi:hypothetical protein
MLTIWGNFCPQKFPPPPAKPSEPTTTAGREKQEFLFSALPFGRKWFPWFKKPLWSEKVDGSILSGVASAYIEALKETVEKPLVLTSRSYAEENYILTCNENTGDPEALFVIPETFKEDAEEIGLILKEGEGLAVYFDAETRLPIPEISCEELKEQVDSPVFTLQTILPPPEELLEEMQNYIERIKEETSGGTATTTTQVYSPPLGGGVSIVK